MFKKEKYMLERSIMVLYHGSPESRAKKIIEKGEISNWCERIWKGNLDGKDIGTTDGYIYLSDKFSKAAFYGNASKVCCDEDSFYVFRINMDISELKQDADELRINCNINNASYSAKESLDICHCVSVGHCINKKEYSIEYMRIGKENPQLKKLVTDLCGKYKSESCLDPCEELEHINRVGKWVKM